MVQFFKKYWNIFWPKILKILQFLKPESAIYHIEGVFHREFEYLGFSKSVRDILFLILFYFIIFYSILFPFLFAWDYIFPETLFDWIDFWLDRGDIDQAIIIDQISYDTQLEQAVYLLKVVKLVIVFWIIFQFWLKYKKYSKK
jgi:hypothetical protein